MLSEGDGCCVLRLDGGHRTEDRGTPQTSLHGGPGMPTSRTFHRPQIVQKPLARLQLKETVKDIAKPQRIRGSRFIIPALYGCAVALRPGFRVATAVDPVVGVLKKKENSC